MQHCYIISYDLFQSCYDYSLLFRAIKSFPKWARIHNSLWAVVTDATADEIRDFLSRYIDEEDNLIVIKSGRIAAWTNIIASDLWCKIKDIIEKIKTLTSQTDEKRLR